MEAMQYLREKVDKKKETLHHLKHEVEEVIEDALVRRRSQRSNDAASDTTVTGDESRTQSSIAGTRCGYQIVDVSVDAEMKLPAVDEVDDNHADKSKKTVYLDVNEGASQEGSHVVKIPKVEAVSAKLKDVDIEKVLSAVINGKNVESMKKTLLSRSTLPPSTKPQEEDGTTSVRPIKNETGNLKIDVVDESDEEVLELEFERAVEKMHTHEYNMHCPNCSNRITKVILRRKKREKKTPAQDLLGCLSCFSIFIPKGNILDPFKIFGSGKKHESSQIHQEQQPSLVPGSTVQQQRTPGGTIPDKDGASQPVKPNNDAVGYSSANANEASASDNVDGTVPHGKPHPGISNGVSSLDGSTSKGNVFIDIPDKLDGTTQGTKHPLKPISEIEEGQKVTNGQYPVQTEPSQNLTGTLGPLMGEEARSSKPREILKSIVYGGLMESITSLSIVSSAAASDATTSNVVALGLANLIGGLLVLFHNLKDLRYEESNEANEVKSRYQELLGLKENFLLHSIFAVLSYLVFGLIPPVVYGFTFRETDDKDFKLLAIAASSLVCIVILAIAKAYTRGQHKFMAYAKTALYYVTSAVMVSGIAYAVGRLIKRLIDSLGWFDSNPVEHLLIPENKTWASF